MRLVDADALIANRQILRGEDVIGIRDYVTVAEIENAPTIEPERETGKWIDGSIPTYFVCSVCAYQERYADENNYCPNCGARMSGGEQPCN